MNDRNEVNAIRAKWGMLDVTNEEWGRNFEPLVDDTDNEMWEIETLDNRGLTRMTYDLQQELRDKVSKDSGE